VQQAHKRCSTSVEPTTTTASTKRSSAQHEGAAVELVEFNKSDEIGIFESSVEPARGGDIASNELKTGGDEITPSEAAVGQIGLTQEEINNSMIGISGASSVESKKMN